MKSNKKHIIHDKISLFRAKLITDDYDWLCITKNESLYENIIKSTI